MSTLTDSEISSLSSKFRATRSGPWSAGGPMFSWEITEKHRGDFVAFATEAAISRNPLKALSEKTERLIRDVAAISGRLDNVESTLRKMRGALPSPLEAHKEAMSGLFGCVSTPVGYYHAERGVMLAPPGAINGDFWTAEYQGVFKHKEQGKCPVSALSSLWLSVECEDLDTAFPGDNSKHPTKGVGALTVDDFSKYIQDIRAGVQVTSNSRMAHSLILSRGGVKLDKSEAFPRSSVVRRGRYGDIDFVIYNDTPMDTGGGLQLSLDDVRSDPGMVAYHLSQGYGSLTVARLIESWYRRKSGSEDGPSRIVLSTPKKRRW